MNVPIPICYFAELETGQYSVIDGQQRLSAIHRFLNNEYPLRGLRVRDELNGKRFHQLDTEEQRLIKSRALRVIIVLKESHPDIRFDVFERLNTTSVKLSTQELRNCIYRWALNDMVKELSQHPTFQYIRNVCEPDLRMRDIEMILRFFAFYERLPLYSGNLKKFLDDYQKDGMKRNMDDLDKLKTKFVNIIEDVKFIFGNNAFRRYDPAHSIWEKSVNRAVYDAVMICFAKGSSDEIRVHKDDIINGFMDLCTNNTEFNDAITSSTKDRAKVKNRIIKFREMMLNKGISVSELGFWNGD